MKHLVLVLLCALLTTGCADNAGDPFDDKDEMDVETLQQRPSMDEITARYGDMQAQLRDRLSSELGLGADWIDEGDFLRAGCKGSDLPATAEQHSLNRWAYRGQIPDDQWARAQQIVADVAGGSGFGAPEVVLDRPGNHRIVLTDSFGAELSFGTKVHTTLQVRTGCHLVVK
ncbi:LppA family lipoprotein [Saccharopolyspora sp. ID03-671]|uniref:LppA family lipoprotein n=1 Tax=Saccharopolyspora sp. ID03-671 TaxID=3073066 RepID=UPI003250A637